MSQRLIAIVALVGGAVIAGCGGSGIGAPHSETSPCGPPPPEPAPFGYLAYPQPGATAVPRSPLIVIGEEGISVLDLAPSAGGPAVVLTPHPVPSPLPSAFPSPLATPPDGDSLPLYGAGTPQLAASTTYVVSYAYQAYAATPPCVETQTRVLGSFTTSG
ncbi:MAG TPA: hypothetical protein VFB22_00930 [Candidatus Baltobacteraceae bacterium]|nr:hypothetical protein [Candidatus Baltobacteraceae bacterium]